MTKLDKLTKDDLLNMLQHIDQHFWPPRPTRQTAATLRGAIEQAKSAQRISAGFGSAVEGALSRRNQKLHERRLAWNLANQRHPLPVSGK